MKLKQVSEAASLIKELKEKYAQRQASAFDVARAYAGFPQKDEVFEWLEKNFQDRGSRLLEITWDIAFDDLRGDHRYAELVRRVGLPQ